MAVGDITYKTIKITVDDETGVINYATQKYIEDSDGVLNAVGALHRPGVTAPRLPVFDDEGNRTGWKDNTITDKPQIIQDISGVVWTSERKTAYENKNS